jgi:hypothetical protein
MKILRIPPESGIRFKCEERHYSQNFAMSDNLSLAELSEIERYINLIIDLTCSRLFKLSIGRYRSTKKKRNDFDYASSSKIKIVDVASTIKMKKYILSDNLQKLILNATYVVTPTFEYYFGMP